MRAIRETISICFELHVWVLVPREWGSCLPAAKCKGTFMRYVMVKYEKHEKFHPRRAASIARKVSNRRTIVVFPGRQIVARNVECFTFC